jgi:ABC-2 type transport system permease protein
VPIHEQTYRRYGGPRRPPGGAWAVIASTGLRSLFGRRAFLALLLLAWVPVVVRAVQFYVAANVPQAAFFAPTAATFRDFLDQQGPFVFFLAIYAGAGLVANDRRANALQIYLSKPLRRAEYIAGKLAVVGAVLLLATWVPALVLLLLQVLFSGSFAFVRNHLFLVPAVTLASLLQAIVAGLTVLALSSLSTSGRFAGMLYAGAVFFSKAVFLVLMFVTGGSRVSWVSFSDSLAQVVDVIFRTTPRHETPWQVSLLVLVALVVLSLSVLERRVRGVEVVA